MFVCCCVFVFFFFVFSFFFKQKTAYEIQYGLVGSEMCIRDRTLPLPACTPVSLPGASCIRFEWDLRPLASDPSRPPYGFESQGCLLYTSDAADERSSVDLGGRRIIKKKTIQETAPDRGINKKISTYIITNSVTTRVQAIHTHTRSISKTRTAL